MINLFEKYITHKYCCQYYYKIYMVLINSISENNYSIYPLDSTYYKPLKYPHG